jgi:Helix-turn-helix domain
MDLTPRQHDLIEATRTRRWLHELLTIEELSEFLGVSIRTIQRMHTNRQGPPRRRKSYRLMYPIPALLDWLGSKNYR